MPRNHPVAKHLPLKLWLIRRKYICDHDENSAFVVAAGSPQRARAFAAAAARDEGPAVWQDSALSRTVCIGTAAPKTKPGVLLAEGLDG